ncbi:hypothetical protein [Desulfoluna sp.]|uniref:hypothetical protein n=1 Tax=Desulfoluna sp. TaxID=2045199 RepID=UPI0026017CAB|nr:hypothetical protein [Desulfoluna sp.]
MRQFANLFLILFLADGAISTLDELLMAVSGMHLLIQVRDLLGFSVLFLSGLFFFAMGMDRRIPKRIFLPMTCYAMWGGLMFWPMPLFIPEGAVGLVMAVGQLVLGLLGLQMVRKHSDHPFLISPAMFSGSWFSAKNALVFFLASFLLIPIALCLIGFSAFTTFVETQTSGFMRITPTGIYMNEKIYGKNGKTLRLVPMIHIGRTDYYDEVGGSMANGKTLILAEGVTDREGLLKTKLSYDRIGKLLGLASQAQMPLDATWVSSDFLPIAPPINATDRKPHIVSADVDLSDFSAVTVAFIGVLANVIMSSDSLPEGYARYTTWVDAQVHIEQVLEAITHDLFTQRNNTVFAMFNKALPHYDTLIIPWGALHMAELEKEAQRLGFIQLGTKERLSVNFREAIGHLKKKG